MRSSIAKWKWMTALAVVVVSSTAGCRGGANAGANDDQGPPDGGDPNDPDALCEADPVRVGMQRLTRSEYNRTVRDLFGVTGAPADVFPPDSASDGFDNNASSLTISPQLAALLLDAAETVATEAMANDTGQIIACNPAADPQCGPATVRALANRVYRRPATDDEVADLMALVDLAAAEGETFEDGIALALQAMLMAPQFLYRSVPSNSMGLLEAGSLVPLDDYALASRLSYFLWGSTPDDTLLARANDADLHDPDVLREQFDRMLADPKSEALYEGFMTQWLQLGRLDAASPDPDTFPAYGEALEQDMRQELALFFEDLRARDGSMLELITSNRTFANEPLAEIYGVDGVVGDQLVPIETDAQRRAGLLTMPAILTMTSGPEQPNIVWRGVWLAETMLCVTPPPPPDDVPAAPDPTPNETERERLERHRADPQCSSCHTLIDPLGFSLEHYDALGHWRDTIDGEAIDDLGALPDGTQYEGAIELSAALASGEAFPTCVTEKLMTYALGRTITAQDHCVVSNIGLEHITPDSSLSDLLWAVVDSDAFQMEIAG